MLYQIIWTDDAIEDYHNNISYLLKDWSIKIAQNFIEETEEILDLIGKSPFIFPSTKYLSVRKTVLRKQISIFYKVEENNIYLIRFWNNYQEPKKLKL